MNLDNRQKHLPAGGKLFSLAALLLLIGLAVGAVAASAPRDSSANAAKSARVVAVGDVHGDYDALVAILQRAALIDAKLNWIGDGATLVQTGDFLDRGEKCLQVMDLLMSLEKQAARKKGRVIVILGNHEAMNLYGDLRYAKNMFASFADKNSEQRRTDAWRDYVKWQKARAKELGKPEPVLSDTPDDEWLKAHPLGFFEQREAFAPTGKYGRWLREHSALAVVDGTLFVHGGISPELASWKIEAISKRVAD
ncbi:MAG TPA: metallophosphoesterase, partial [Candidatus Nitrosotenuis sp.]|nr:metallophosphoesterase [Candidatus Nitrosotenuis sp.]